MAKLDFKNAARRNKNLKYGGYATIVTVICVVILVVVNLLFEKLNLTIDLTQEELYTVSEETMEILNELDEEVDIYGFYVSGEESGTYNSMVVNFLERYEALNKNLHFELKDPVSDPAFANQFLKGPNETITSGNVVVTAKNTGRYKILALADMLQFSYDQSSSNGYRVSGWNAEAAITGAVQYVTSDKTPALYQLVGHGETMLDDRVTGYLNTSNFDVLSLNLVSGDEITPENYNTILINNPKADITDMEYDTILDYMEHGGRLIFMFEYNLPELKNFDRLLSRFGMTVDRSGFIVETDQTHYYSYPQLIIPNMQTENDMTEIIQNLESNTQLLFLAPASIKESEDRNRLTKLTNLLFTSEVALIKAEGNTMLAYEDGDQKGPFNLITMAVEQEQVGTNVATAELCVIGSSSFIDYEAASGLVTNGNYQLFLNICSYMQDEVSTLYIPPKEFSSENLINSMRVAITGGVIFVIVIPLAIIGIGVFIWMRRKKL